MLQHPQEQDQAKGSLPLLRLSLRRCRCEVGEHFDAAQLAAWIGDPAAASLLYPAQADQGRSCAAHADAAAKSADAAVSRLVVLDGSWRNTRKLLHLNPCLHRLRRWALVDPPPSRYTIRRAQRADQRSTLEAVCLALDRLENRPGLCRPLLAAFDGWVADRARDAAGRPFA